MICGLTNFMWSCDSHHSSDFSFRCQSLILTPMALPRQAGRHLREYKFFGVEKFSTSEGDIRSVWLVVLQNEQMNSYFPHNLCCCCCHRWRGSMKDDNTLGTRKYMTGCFYFFFLGVFFQNSTIQCCSHFVFCFYGNGLSVCFYLCLPKVMYDTANTTFWYLIWAALQGAGGSL